MICRDARPLLSAFLDNELDAVKRTEVDKHLVTCAACRDELAALREVSAAVRERATRFRPSAQLSRSVTDGVRRASRKSAAPATRSYRPLALAAAIFFLTAILSIGLELLPLSSGDDAVSHAAAAYRHLQADGGRTEIASSDARTLTTWAAAHGVGFAPVADLSPEGFTLLGARRESVAGASAVALVYRQGDRFVDLLVAHAPGAAPQHARLNREDDVAVVDWTESGLRFLAVSNLDGEALMRFHKSVEGAIRSP